MRKIFNLFAIFTICVLLFAACNIGKSKSKTAIGGAFNGVITARVENGDTLNSIITNLHVAMGMNNIFNNTSSYTNGGFTFTLPETPDSEMEWFGSEMSGFPSHYNISDRETNYITFYEIYGADSDGARVAKFQLILNESEWESVYISFWYVDRDVNVDGMLLKKGWNTVQTKEYFESGNVEWKTASIDSKVKWRFEEMYFYEEPNNPTLYDGIIYGDLFEFAGTWVNGRGERRQLRANGTFNAGETAYGFKIGNENDQHTAGTYYQWIVNMGGEAGGFEVWLYPAGVAVRNYIEDYGWDVVATHITMDRIFVESVGSSYDAYYREGELRPPSDDFVLGSWMFKSGRNVYFFGQAPSIDFLPDKTVNVLEQGDQYLRIARSGIWGFTPEGRLFVEYDWNTYYFLFSSDMENLIIIDSDGNRGVFGKVYG